MADVASRVGPFHLDAEEVRVRQDHGVDVGVRAAGLVEDDRRGGERGHGGDDDPAVERVERRG